MMYSFNLIKTTENSVLNLNDLFDIQFFFNFIRIPLAVYLKCQPQRKKVSWVKNLHLPPVFRFVNTIRQDRT